MIARYFTSILFILFFVHLSYVNAEKNHNETNTHIFLTDMTNTHHAIPYLNMDQCMLRPDQKEHGSFGLIFFRPDFYLCDKLLICYPSQLVGNNTRNGIIASIPYRLRESKPNNITKQCEEKRQEFCNEAKNKHLCSLGQPASTIWHGIMLTTEYLTLDQTEVYVTTISLSITKKKYTIEDFLDFNIEFGKKDDVTTYISIRENIFGFKYEKLEDVIFGEDLVKEYMSNVEIGAYLHKYAGLWSLGLDLLPTTTQRFLHLFVYRGCGCAIDVWFKTPTTPDSLLPEKPEISKSDGRGGLFKDKDCSKRFTNEIVHSLGNISAGEKLVSFSLWSGNEGKEGLIKIYNDSKNDLIDYKNDIFVIHFYDDFIVFFPYGRDEHRKVEKVAENLLAIGAKIKVTVIISKYYIWILIESDDDVFVEFTYKFWPLYWWNGDFLNNTEVKMSIKGDFLMVTPLIIDTLNDEDKIEWSNDMKVVREMPYSLEISESTTTSINYRFYCMLNDNATAFDIKLLNGVEEVNHYVGTVIYGLDVNNNLTNVTISTDSCTDDDCVYTNLDFKSFVKGNPLECLIEVTKKGGDITIETFINGEYVNAKLESNFNIWMINRISVGGDIQLLQYRIDPKGEQIMQPDLVHRREIKELKSYGTIVCFEAYVPSAGDMDNYFIFQVKLIHDSHIRKQNDVVTVLELEFEFEPTRYPALGKNFKHIKGELFSLTVRSYDGTSREFKLYPNPIGQTGVPIFVLIYANKYFYTISVNGGDYIHYPHIFPVWSINRVEITGSITEVRFNEHDIKSEKCRKLEENFDKFKLPKNIAMVKGKLTSKSVVSIFGRIPKSLRKSVKIYFLHAAIQWDIKYGNTVFQLKITRNTVCIDSYTKREWINLSKNITKCHNHPDLKEEEKIKLIFTFANSSVFYILETKENAVEKSFELDLPISLTQYIEVKELDITDFERPIIIEQ